MASKTYSRILDDNRHAGYFIENVLQIDKTQRFAGISTQDLILKISSAEKQLSTIIDGDTLYYHDNRLPEYNSNKSRVQLRKTIYKELTTQRRLKNDDDIRLGKGGALPLTELKADRKAFYVIGLPASGKSGISNMISDKFGAMILDSDYAKRKIPEYDIDFGAAVVHEESSVIVFGGTGKLVSEPSLLQYAVENGYNIVIPKIGHNSDKVEEFAKLLVESGYEIHLILVRLDRQKATIRACHRYAETGRYVSLSLIFDVYGNDPTITFYDLQRTSNAFSSYTMFSTDVPIGVDPDIVYCSETSPFRKMP